MKSCEMQALVSARRDGRLADKESASVARHLRSCRRCRELDSDLDRVAALARDAGDLPALSPLEHRRRRLAVLQAAAAPRAPETGTRRPLALALAAIATMIVGWLVFAGPGASSMMQTAPPRQVLAVHTAAAIAASVFPAPEAHFERQTVRGADGEQLERVRLHDGVIDVQVDALREGQRFIVATSDAEVEVRGTRFTVFAESGALREVRVQEGVVDVRQNGRTTTLAVGDVWRAPERVATADDAEPEPHPDVTRPSVPRTPIDKPVPDPDEDEVEDEETSDAADSEAAEPSGPAKRERSAASKAFAAAMNKLDRGDYDGATSALEAFSREHEGDARAEDAHFLRIVALQRAGRHAAAANAARSYLAKYPRGARRAEAAAIARRKRP